MVPQLLKNALDLPAIGGGFEATQGRFLSRWRCSATQLRLRLNGGIIFTTTGAVVAAHLQPLVGYQVVREGVLEQLGRVSWLQEWRWMEEVCDGWRG